MATSMKKLARKKLFCLLLWASITAFSINGLKKQLGARIGDNASKTYTLFGNHIKNMTDIKIYNLIDQSWEH